jgi:hypothetical protein
VAEKFAAAHPEFWTGGDGKTLWRHSERPWQLATPDRLVHPLIEVHRCTCGADLQMHYGHEPRCGLELGQPVAVLETKTDAGSDEWGEPGTDEIPVHYRCQVLWQMDVMGVSRAYVSCLDPARWQIREYVIEHAEGCGPGHNLLAYPSLACQVCDDQVRMREEARSFLFRIEVRAVPDVDWRPSTIGALKQLHPSVIDEGVFVSDQLGKRYRAALKNSKYWEQRKKLYEAQLRERMGSARRACLRSEDIPAGEVIARRDVYEVGESVRKGYTVDKLMPVYPKKEKKSVSSDGA